mmetsp:Transcript_52475/g.63218  ORF Transcript_52475/g.63218 Transcript_52475/m.63218 type:complete len:113 (-) Transcript_52475:1757-2095(-)
MQNPFKYTDHMSAMQFTCNHILNPSSSTFPKIPSIVFKLSKYDGLIPNQAPALVPIANLLAINRQRIGDYASSTTIAILTTYTGPTSSTSTAIFIQLLHPDPRLVNAKQIPN